MKRIFFILMVLAIGLAFFGCEETEVTKAGAGAVEIVIGKDADNMERFAASELQSYMEKLFGISASISDEPGKKASCLFLLGNAENNATLAKALGENTSPELSDQGFYLKTTAIKNKPVMVIAGGSGKAVMWGVYELAERYGVRYLLHEDVLPAMTENFELKEIDKVFEPLLKVRKWRVVNDFAMGPESWGIAEYERVLGQLAKMKFNQIMINTWPWQPFLHLELKGVKKSQAYLWFNYKYPITDDMPGRFLYGDEKEFWNPDLPVRGESYEDFSAAGEQLCHNIINLAHNLGMKANFSASVVSFPKELASAIPGAKTLFQLESLTVGPGPEVMPDNEELMDIAGTVVRTIIDTYPDADIYGFTVPEFRSWTKQYQWAWDKFDEKHNISKIMSPDKPLAQAAKRVQSWGGAERSINEVQGDMAALYFYEKLFTNPDVLPMTTKPNAKIEIGNTAEELFPIMGKILPPGADTLVFIDYTASAIVGRREVIGTLPTKDVNALLIYTLHDDNVGVLPQLVTGSLHELSKDLRKHGWQGFMTRYWLISDHDTCVSYIAKTAWDADVTPRSVAADQIRMVCGEKAVGPMVEALEELERNTIALENYEGDNTFPVPNMMLKNWKPEPLDSDRIEARASYQRSLDLVKSIAEPATQAGKDYVNYWIGRFSFGVKYIDTIEAVKNAAMAEKRANEAKEQGKIALYKTAVSETIAYAQKALDSAV